MVFVPLPNTAKVCLDFAVPGGRAQICLHFTKSTAWGTIEMADLGDAVAAWWSTDVNPHIAAAVALENVRITDERTVNGYVVESFLDPVVYGLKTNSLPMNVAYVVTFTTGLKGRSYRGRCYLPGLNEADTTGDYVSVAWQASILAAVINLSTYLTTPGWVWVIASRYHDGQPRVQGITTPVVGVVADRICDSQRRRLPGRGS